jgi:hypothetical protein
MSAARAMAARMTRLAIKAHNCPITKKRMTFYGQYNFTSVLYDKPANDKSTLKISHRIEMQFKRDIFTRNYELRGVARLDE